jgi:hypothetical protein
MLGVSVAWLRASECPKVLLPGNGPKGRPVVRYRERDLLAWAERHTKRSTMLRRGRASGGVARCPPQTA